MLFRKILYPVDFEKASLNVKPYILKLREAGCEEVHILHVLIPSRWGLLSKEEYDSLEKVEALRGALSEGYADAVVKLFKRMEELAAEFEENGIKTKTVIIPGELDEVLASYAEKHGINLVALGVSDESLSIFHIGRVLDVIKNVKQPILIVKS